MLKVYSINVQTDVGNPYMYIVHTLQEFFTFGIVITCGNLTSLNSDLNPVINRVRYRSINFNFLRSCVKIASLRCPFIITVHCFTPFYLVKKFLMNKQKAKSSIGVGKAVVSNYADTVLVLLLTNHWNQTRCWYTVVVDKAFSFFYETFINQLLKSSCLFLKTLAF